ncbi:S24 family peptidase [Streptococcus ruminantium]|uniref:S24 family peptidase n=1 Tax=Streptococcus ruminantium TaxID=1917441 RepID=UPI0012DD0498|nr:S24 family peptidase [Streptococcus ruminantium]
MNESELKLLIENRYGSVRAFAIENEIPYTTMRSILERGVLNAKAETIFKICSILKIRPENFGFLLPEAPNSLVEKISDKVVYLDQELEEPRHSAWISHGEQLLKEQSSASTISDNVVDLYDTRKRVTGIVDFSASAGTGVWQDENLGMEVSFYEDDMAEDYDSIGIVMGSSMEPVLKNGDYLFVKVTPDIPNGSISIWQVNGENFVKKFRKNGKPYLESLNPEFGDIDLNENDDIRPLGVVVEVYRER